MSSTYTLLVTSIKDKLPDPSFKVLPFPVKKRGFLPLILLVLSKLLRLHHNAAYIQLEQQGVGIIHQTG